MSKLHSEVTEGVLSLSDAERVELICADQDSLGPLYAVFDSGVLINLCELAETHAQPGLCLYKGELANEMRDQAPFVYPLDRSARFLGCVAAQSDAPWHLWGRGGGILMNTHASPEQIQAHWRKFTRVQDARGTSYLFRFWEPDMFLAFLQVCDDRELDGIFGGDLITRLRLPVAKGDELADLRLDPVDPEARARAFPLRPAHFNAFATVSWGRHLVEMVAYAREIHGLQVASRDDDALKAWLDGLLRRAHGQYGLTQTGPQKVFVDAAVAFGEDFDTAQPWAAKVLTSPNFSGQMARARALQSRAEAHAPMAEA